MSKLLRCVGYCRVSTQNQKEEGTIEIQRLALQKYAERNGFLLVNMFEDNGVSGTFHDRPGLNNMIDFLELDKDITHVIIYKLDRLARDLYLQEHLIRQFEAFNVTLLSTQEDNLDSDDIMRKAFRQFSGIVSELEKGFILMRLSGGRDKKASTGGWAGGRTPYGYQAKDKELSIDKDMAMVVASIFSMRRNKHMTLRDIAQQLNTVGVPTAMGKRWHASTVQYILKNTTYKGVLKFKEHVADRLDLKLPRDRINFSLYKKEAQFVQESNSKPMDVA